MSTNMIPVKHHVTVNVRFTASGDMIPQAIKWTDGRLFEIDRVLDVRNAPSEAGGVGKRYRVRIMGQVRDLYYANNYSQGGELGWFIESKKQYQRGEAVEQKNC